MVRNVMIGIAAVAAASLALAQDSGQVKEKTFFFQRFADGPGPALAPLGGNVGFISAEMSFEGKTVTGAPYSAEAITETTQTLADGNRISHTTKSLMARDSQGRVRREQTIGSGMLASAQGESMKLVIINDPVAEISYVLNPDHTAQKMPLAKAPMGMPAGGYTISTGSGAPGGPGLSTSIVLKGAAADSKPVEVSSKATVESLGEQTIEGVSAEGKRTTSVIPAGTIGNEQDIKIVNESWYSNDLQTLISSTRTDPRMGTTTFRLTNIQRTEPAPELFQVPSDYTLRDLPKPGSPGVNFEYRVQK